MREEGKRFSLSFYEGGKREKGGERRNSLITGYDGEQVKKSFISVNGVKVEFVDVMLKGRKVGNQRNDLEEKNLKKNWIIDKNEKSEIFENFGKNEKNFRSGFNSNVDFLSLSQEHRRKSRPSTSLNYESNRSNNRVWRITKKPEEELSFGIKGSLRLKKLKDSSKFTIQPENSNSQNNRPKTTSVVQRKKSSKNTGGLIKI